MTRAVCEGMYVQQVLAEAGLPGKMCLHGDATAALQNAMKLSGGRMRHLKSAQSFIKQVVKDELVTLVKSLFRSMRAISGSMLLVNVPLDRRFSLSLSCG